MSFVQTVLSLFIADLTDVLKCGKNLAKYEKNVVQIGNQQKIFDNISMTYLGRCVFLSFPKHLNCKAQWQWWNKFSLSFENDKEAEKIQWLDWLIPVIGGCQIN